MGLLAGTVALLVLHLCLDLTPLLVVLPAVLSFFLLNRFDEAYAYPFGQYTVKVNYWFAVICVAVLAIGAVLRPCAESLTRRGLRRFSAWYGLGLVTFVLLGLLSIVMSVLSERYVAHPSAVGELLGLGLVCVPMAFPIVIVLSSLTKRQVLMSLRFMLAMAAATGFVMVVFSLFPQVVAEMLGWIKELGGGGGLVRGQTPLGHPNTVSAVMTLLLPLAVILGLRHRSAIWTPFYLASALFLMGGILFSLSRTAAAIATVVVLMCLLYLLLAAERHRVVALASILIFVATATAVGSALFSNYDFSRFWSRQYFEDANVERRLQTMETALLVIRDHPLLGVAPNSVYPQIELNPGWIPEGMDQLGALVFYRGHLTTAHPDNLVLMVLAEFGLLGGAVFFALLALPVLAIWRGWRSCAPSEALERPTLAAFLIAFVAFLGVGLGAALVAATIRVGLIYWILFGLGARYSLLVIEGRQPEVHNANAAPRLAPTTAPIASRR